MQFILKLLTFIIFFIFLVGIGLFLSDKPDIANFTFFIDSVLMLFFMILMIMTIKLLIALSILGTICTLIYFNFELVSPFFL